LEADTMKERRIALCMELADFYEHGIARGVVRYAKSKPQWRLFGYGWMFRSIHDLRQWRGDGILSRIESEGAADSLAALGLPLVDVAGAYRRPGFSKVTNDDRLTGRRAVDYLQSIGFQRIAYLGVPGVAWSAERRAGAVEAMGRGSQAVPVFERSLPWWECDGPKGPGKADAGDRSLERFIASLEKPAAIFACNDTAGLRAVGVCHRLGIAVPEEIAVLGVDDEDIVCELSSPSLSSIALDCETIGYRAAGLLDSILDGGGAEAHVVPPGNVTERESTRTFASDDALVSKAATIIRARAHLGLDVQGLLELLPASRRSIETRYKQVTGRTLHEEIIAVRVARAKRLLGAGDLTMEAVAEGSGFGCLQRFHEAFRLFEGTSPGAWRTAERHRKLHA
jgi:LacI family transcriptional regulator